MIMNMIDFDMDVLQAISSPRISFVEPDGIAVGERIPAQVRRELAAMGHNLRTAGGLGSAHALTIRYNRRGTPTGFTGAADPRGGGLARGY